MGIKGKFYALIKGLIGVLGAFQDLVTKYKITRLGVDAPGLLHRAVHMHSFEVLVQGNYKGVLWTLRNYITELKKVVEPVMVLDGCALPGKSGTDLARLEAFEKNKATFEAALQTYKSREVVAADLNDGPTLDKDIEEIAAVMLMMNPAEELRKMATQVRTSSKIFKIIFNVNI
jgi:hypothetical protein